MRPQPLYRKTNKSISELEAIYGKGKSCFPQMLSENL